MCKARIFSGLRPSTQRAFRPSHFQTWRILASNKARPYLTRELKTSRKENSRYGNSPDILRVVSQFEILINTSASDLSGRCQTNRFNGLPVKRLKRWLT